MAELKDLAGLSKPLNKLVKAVTRFTDPLYVRQMAKAEVEVAVIKAEGEQRLREIKERATRRLEAQELIRQQNIDSIVSQAVLELPEAVSEKSVDGDWIAEFFNCCQDVSDEQMQSLWAKLLAGEITEPGRFSLRTLNFVKTLRSWEAQMFTNFCKYIWTQETDDYRNATILGYISTPETDKMINVFPGGFMHLEDIGLISRRAIFTFDQPLRLVYHGKKYLVRSAAPQIELSIIPVTLVGHELAPLSGAKPEDLYIFPLINSIHDSRGLPVELVPEEMAGQG